MPSKLAGVGRPDPKTGWSGFGGWVARVGPTTYVGYFLFLGSKNPKNIPPEPLTQDLLCCGIVFQNYSLLYINTMDELLLKCGGLSSAQLCKYCRSRQELSNELFSN